MAWFDIIKLIRSPNVAILKTILNCQIKQASIQYLSSSQSSRLIRPLRPVSCVCLCFWPSFWTGSSTAPPAASFCVEHTSKYSKEWIEEALWSSQSWLEVQQACANAHWTTPFFFLSSLLLALPSPRGSRGFCPKVSSYSETRLMHTNSSCLSPC